MKTKKIISIILAAIMLMSVIPVSMFTVGAEEALCATGQCGDNVFWTFDSETGALTLSGTGATWNYDSYYHGASPFDGKSTVKTITVDDGVTALGSELFSNCSCATNISLPATLNKIERYAFSFCKKLNNVVIPDSVEGIDSGAFSECKNLTDIVLSKNLKFLGGRVFNGTALYNNCEDNAVYVCNCLVDIKDKSITSIEVKDGTELIAEGTFWYCYDLAQVTLPDTLKYLHYHTFGSTALINNCTDDIFYVGNYLVQVLNRNIKNVDIKDGTILIAQDAFQGNMNIDTVNTPDSLKYICLGAFGNAKIKTLNISKSVEPLYGLPDSRSYIFHIDGQINVDPENPYYSSEDGVLFNKDKTVLFAYPAMKTEKTYTVPSTVKTIYDHAFAYNLFLENITLPYGLKKIGESAFEYTSRLKSMTVPDTIEEIGDGAFEISGIKELIIHKTDAKFGDCIMDGCYSLKEIEFGSDELIDEILDSVSLQHIVNVSDDAVIPAEQIIAFKNTIPEIELFGKAVVMGIEYQNIKSITDSDSEIIELYEEYMSGRLDEYAEIISEINRVYSVNISTAVEDLTASIQAAVQVSCQYEIIDGMAPDFNISCSKNSAQHTYCIENGIKHSIIGSDFDCACGIHDVVLNDYIAPTCVNNGYIGGKVCRICETVFEEPQIVPPTNEHTDRNKDDYCDVCSQWLGKEEEPDLAERFVIFIKGIVDAIIALFRRLFG